MASGDSAAIAQAQQALADAEVKQEAAAACAEVGTARCAVAMIGTLVKSPKLLPVPVRLLATRHPLPVRRRWAPQSVERRADSAAIVQPPSNEIPTPNNKV